MGLSLAGISTLDILAFMDFLAQSSMSLDHITVVRSLYIVYNGDSSPFSDQRISSFVK